MARVIKSAQNNKKAKLGWKWWKLDQKWLKTRSK